MTQIISSNVKGLFEVPIMSSQVFLPHELIAMDVIKHCARLNDYTTYHNGKYSIEWFNHMPAKKYFVDIVESLVQEYLEASGRRRVDKKIHITAWGSVWRQGQVHTSHVHRHSILAGTYYPQADNSSVPITFECPWGEYCMADTIHEDRLLYKHQPVTGDLLLWPAWLRHYVGVQGEQKRPAQPRVAISFNINYD